MNAVCFDSESYNHQSNFYQFVSTKHESTSNFRLPSKRGFKIASLNVNSLSAHIDEVRILLGVLAIQETKLNNSHRDSEFYTPLFGLLRRDRISDGGGGVCFYIKSSINFSVRNDLNIADLENVFIEVRKPQSKPVIVVNWYRPPNSHVRLYSHLENLIRKLDLTNFDFFLLGDMHIDMATTKSDIDARQLNNIADICGQLINEPTRITDKSTSLIDLIDTNSPERVVCSLLHKRSYIVLFMCTASYLLIFPRDILL